MSKLILRFITAFLVTVLVVVMLVASAPYKRSKKSCNDCYWNCSDMAQKSYDDCKANNNGSYYCWNMVYVPQECGCVASACSSCDQILPECQTGGSQ